MEEQPQEAVKINTELQQRILELGERVVALKDENKKLKDDVASLRVTTGDGLLQHLLNTMIRKDKDVMTFQDFENKQQIVIRLTRI